MIRRRSLTGLTAAIVLLQLNCVGTSDPALDAVLDGGALPYPDGGEPRDGRRDAGRTDDDDDSARDSGRPHEDGTGKDSGAGEDRDAGDDTGPGEDIDAGKDSGTGDSGSPAIVGGGVIALEDEPGPRPYLQTPTDHSMWISWWTDTGAESTVEYGTSEELLDRTATGSTADVAPGAASYHLVKLDGLSPDTRYWYRVKTGSNVSRVYRFRTLPPPGDKTGHFRFLIVGDHQIIDEPRHAKMVEAARDKLVEKYGGYIEDAVRLHLGVGDQVDVGTVDHWRNLHFKQSALLTPYIPTMTIVGKS